MTEPLKVVIVEDDQNVASWVSMALGFLADFEVKTITTNFSKLIGNGQWDNVHAVLCDWHLADFDTAQLFEYLAAEKPHVRRVVFSALPPDDIPRDVIDQVVEKPASMDALAKALLGPNQRGSEL